LRSTVANAAEEADLSPSEELFTTVVLGQDNYTAATLCSRVYSSCQSCYGRIFMPKSKAKVTNSKAKVTNSIGIQ